MIRIFLICLMLTTACVDNCHADLVVEYDVEGANASLDATLDILSTGAGVSATEMGVVGALVPRDLNGSFAHRGWSTSASPFINDYYEFSITPDAGTRIAYSTLDLGVFVVNQPSATARFRLQSSLDGFQSSQIIVDEGFVSPQVFNDLDISAVGKQTGQVDFRLQFYQVASSNDFAGLGENVNFVVNGNLSAVVPEPSSPVLLLIAASTFAAARLRRRLLKRDLLGGTALRPK